MQSLRFRDYLSQKQRTALGILMLSGSTFEASVEACVDEKEVIGWLRTDSWFKAALQQEKSDVPESEKSL